MGREKRHTVLAQRKGVHARERHKRFQRARTLDTPLIALNARPEPPNMKSKHHSYYEIVENKDKKKKLEFQITNQKIPPPGFEFIPIGNPDLTLACKELSREQDAMVFIVSNSSPANPLAQQVNRIGHHIRQGIVEEARREISDAGDSSDDQTHPGAPEPIPETQEEIDEQADSAIRDLFPRIPNTDRQTIIEHSFKLGAHKRGEPLVGLAPDIPLSRRVQLAVLAHIRHTHTRYDSLLKETTYSNARKAVEQLCLDVLVKWRGDEENGRDQLDEILREVVVISDSESEDDDEDTEAVEADSGGVEPVNLAAMPGYLSHYGTRFSGRSLAPIPAVGVQYTSHPPADARAQSPYDRFVLDSDRTSYPYVQEGYTAHRARRGFKRYQAALSTRWDEAVNRVRHEKGYHPDEPPPPPLAGNQSYTSYERQQGQWSPNHKPYASSAHGPAYHVDARGDPRSQDIPPQRPIRAAPAGIHQRSPNDLSRGASSHTGPQQRTIERILMRPKEARDFLVPSIEPLSPSSGARPVAPVFIRTVSPNRVLNPTRLLIGDAWDQTRVHDSPRWAREHGSLKRRRSVDVEPYDPRQPAQSASQRQTISNTRQQPLVHYAVAQRLGESPQIASTWNSRAQLAHASTGSATTYPVPNSRSDGLRTEPPVGSEEAPVVFRNWNEDLTSDAETLTAHNFREITKTDRRVSSSRIVRARQDSYHHESENETYFHGLSINDDVVFCPNFQQSLALRQVDVPRDAVPLQCKSSRRSPSYLPRVRDSNPSKPKSINCSATYHPAVSSFTRHHEGSEPATVFVRHVDRQRQPRMIEDRYQQYQYDDPDRFRTYQRPPTTNSSCALPQAMPPYDESYGNLADYPTPHHLPTPHRAGSHVFQEYPNRHKYRRNQENS